MTLAVKNKQRTLQPDLTLRELDRLSKQCSAFEQLTKCKRPLAEMLDSIPMWQYQGNQRPDFAIDPGPNQESVWNYPRPPKLERTNRRVVVKASGSTIVDTGSAFRLMETASPPTFYLPIAQIDMTQLLAVAGSSLCEWKGLAQYYALAEDPATIIAWGYPNSRAPYEKLRACLSFYPGRIKCFVDEERVQPQPGQFYGGWITKELVGPFKGEPGTGHW